MFQQYNKIRLLNKVRQQMGNETVTKTRLRNKNSYSVDFGHQLPGKIKPSNNTFKLIPISDEKNRSQYIQAQQNVKYTQNRNEQDNSNDNGTEQGTATRRQKEQLRKQSSARLKKLNSHNDELRRQLIKISSELTEKLKKKKFQVKKVEEKDPNPKKKESLKKELENAYKQIDMYKRLLYDLKIGESAGAKLLDVEDKIASVDLQIEKTMVQIQAIKNVTSNQNAGIRKDKGWQALQQLKSQAQALKLCIKQKSKQQRQKQKSYMKQHHYMKSLQQRLKQVNEQYEQQYKKSRAIEQQQKYRPTQKQIKAYEQQIQLLKIKHDQYHKKINAYIASNKMLKEEKRIVKGVLDDKVKLVEGFKYKRDALVKQIKDNLHLFATTAEQRDEELSQFQSDQQEIPNPIQQQEDERGTFDIQHLKDHQLKKIPKHQQQQQQQLPQQQAPRSQPKQWKKQLTRIISKGKQTSDQKQFQTGLTTKQSSNIRIVQMSIWMNKKKQITAIQPSYFVDGRVYQGSKSTKNIEDQYKVTFQLEEHDYLKSVLGIFGKTGFLDYLVLQSNFGKISKIGREQTDGDNFAIGVAKQETPVMITGANRQDGAYWRISRLDFQVSIQINS